jgi:LysR family glycine cleavage system transcriptional activator
MAKRRIPPLNALRAFEAAARNLNFGKAAGELNVTRGAISHQVKALEEWVGVDLLQRNQNRVALTDAGRHLLPALNQAFDLIAETVAEIHHPDLKGHLAIHAPPTFTSRWMLPRLGAFIEAYPQIELSMHHVAPFPKLLPGDYDVVIDYGNGRWENRWVHRLMPVDLFPLCSPKLMNSSLHPLRTPSDLKNFTLIHEDDGAAWSQWLSAAGARQIDASRGLHVSTANHALEAALLGLGVALGDQVIMSQDLEDGTLIRPFSFSHPSSAQYYVVCERDRLHMPILRSFIKWLFDMVGTEIDI